MSGQPDRPEAEAEEQETDTPEAVEGSEGAAATDEGDALAEAREQASENWDKYLRAMAELDNVRKRAARDVEHARRFALEQFARELLNVRDSLEMGLAAAEGTDTDALKEGFEATLKQLTATMERFGISEVNAEGEAFDPEHHEAMTTQPSPDVEPGTVLTVFQKGYSLNGRLLRPARVVVAQAVEQPEKDEQGA